MARYTYSGGPTSLSLPAKSEGEEPFEAILHDGQEVELPDHPIIEAWEARGWLTALKNSTSLTPVPQLTRGGAPVATKKED